MKASGQSDTPRADELLGEGATVAQEFLEELATRASASAALDAPWWMALSTMLADGWRVVKP